MKVAIIVLASLCVSVFSSPLNSGATLTATPSTTGTGPILLSAPTIPKPAQVSTSRVNSTAAVGAAAAASDATSCAHHRAREMSSNTRLPGRVIPECSADGKYASLQCHGEAVGGGKFCQCWDPEGNIIRAPSKKVKSCDCILQKHQMTNGRPAQIGGFVPQCEESGHFKKHQCHGSVGLCWCVHPTNGTQIGEKTRGLAAESCV